MNKKAVESAMDLYAGRGTSETSLGISYLFNKSDTLEVREEDCGWTTDDSEVSLNRHKTITSENPDYTVTSFFYGEVFQQVVRNTYDKFCQAHPCSSGGPVPRAIDLSGRTSGLFKQEWAGRDDVKVAALLSAKKVLEEQVIEIQKLVDTIQNQTKS